MTSVACWCLLVLVGGLAAMLTVLVDPAGVIVIFPDDVSPGLCLLIFLSALAVSDVDTCWCLLAPEFFCWLACGSSLGVAWPEVVTSGVLSAFLLHPLWAGAGIWLVAELSVLGSLVPALWPVTSPEVVLPTMLARCAAREALLCSAGSGASSSISSVVAELSDCALEGW